MKARNWERPRRGVPRTVAVPAGSFVMGSSAGRPDEAPPHEVTVRAFHLARTPVTNAEYAPIVEAGRSPAPPWRDDPAFSAPDQPVVGVTWLEACEYARWLEDVDGGSWRLPTEAEWERAARGAAPRRYPWGNLPNPKLANHGALDTGSIYLHLIPFDEPLLGIADASDGHLGLAPVGSFPSGSTPEGLHDLAGNVGEWVADFWADRYSIAAAGNPKGPPNGTLRVVRGGSYRHPIAFIRGASRDRRPASAREPTIGFRCARDGST